MTGGSEGMNSGQKSQSINLEDLLNERERLEELIKTKFKKIITVMFTDFKGSTSITETEGDVFSRMLIKKHNDIVFPLIESNHGVLVKTMGDGTMTYFENAADAVRTAVMIQTNINLFNLTGKVSIPIQLRIGLNTGTGIVEKNDIFGDVVNVASRFESIAVPGEILISETTFSALGTQHEFYCRNIRSTYLKGKKEIFKVYKVFWNQAEIDEDRINPVSTSAEVLFPDPSLSPPKKEPSGSTQTDESLAENSIILQRINKLRKANELIELYLIYEELQEFKDIQKTYQFLKKELELTRRIETLLNGRKAVWFFKDSITIGRIQDADFPISNGALTRLPMHIGIRNGEGIFKIESQGAEKIHATELQRDSRTEIVKPDIEYRLGRSGKIIFAVCFPFEYRIYKERFIVISMMNPEECIAKNFKFRLQDVWKSFESESEKFLIIGT